MRIGLIADDFTRVCLELEPGIEVINLKHPQYAIQILSKKLDLVLVESAWLGINSSWKRKIANYKNQKNCLHMYWLTRLCKLKGIPSVFWNKEDPVCFERFKHHVDNFDVVMTTDENMVARYKKELGARKAIQQSFFFQPKLHNFNRAEYSAEYEDKVLFCGGYYKDEYPNRAARLDWAISGIGENNIVVFDRFNGAQSGWGDKSHIAVSPSFEYEASKYYYQQGIAHLNVNSVDGLRTMFSRRMLELVVCNQKVIDLTNYKKKSLLSDFVIQVSDEKEAREALDKDKPSIDYQYLEDTFSVNAFMKKLKHNI